MVESEVIPAICVALQRAGLVITPRHLDGVRNEALKQVIEVLSKEGFTEAVTVLRISFKLENK